MASKASPRRKRQLKRLPRNLDAIILKALDCFSDGIVIGNLDGIVYYHNKAWLRIHALDESLDLCGKDLRDFERPELLPILMSFTEKLVKRGTYTYQFGTVRRDGMYHDVHLTGNVIREVDPPVAVVILREVTDLVQTQKEVARRNVELELLNEIHRIISGARSRKAVIKQLLKLLGDFIGAKSGGFYLLDHESKMAVLIDSTGIPPRVRKRTLRIPLDPERFGMIMQSPHTFVLEEDMPTLAGGSEDIRKAMGIKRTIGTMFRTGTKREYMTIFGLPEAEKVDPDLRSFFDTAAKQFALAIERIELYDTLEKRERELYDLTVRLIDSSEEEKRQCSLMLHDEIGQALTSLKLELEMLEKRLAPLDSCGRKSLEGIRRQIRFVSESTRSIAKSFHPAMLDELGFVPTLNWYIDNFIRSEGLAVEFTDAGCDKDLPSPVSLALYRVAQEALTNVVRHANASKVSISLTKGFPYAIMEIEDNGKGISAHRANKKPRGLGLVSMRERIEYLGGTFSIRSSPGRGTKVRVRIPIGERHD